MNIQRKPRRKPLIIAVTIVLLLVAVGIAASIQYSNSKNSVGRDKSETSLERSKDELKETQNIQDNPEATKQTNNSDTPSEPAANPDTGVRTVNVVLTSTGVEDGQVDASGFVSNIVEEGGTCTFSFSQNQRTVTKSSTTAINATSTTCKTVRFNQDELGPGEWKVSVKYKSSTAEGTSNIGSLQLQ